MTDNGSKNFKSISVGDIVNVSSRFWKVVGCYFGVVGQENVIGLESLDRSAGTANELLVPLDLIPHEAIFRPVEHESAK